MHTNIQVYTGAAVAYTHAHRHAAGATAAAPEPKQGLMSMWNVPSNGPSNSSSNVPSNVPEQSRDSCRCRMFYRMFHRMFHRMIHEMVHQMFQNRAGTHVDAAHAKEYIYIHACRQGRVDFCMDMSIGTGIGISGMCADGIVFVCLLQLQKGP